MLQISEIRYALSNNPAFVYGREFRWSDGALLTSSDVKSAKLTIYEQSDPYASEGEPLEHFTDRPLDPNVIFFDSLQPGDIQTKYGPKSIQYNMLAVIAPIVISTGGVNETVFPFPVVGKYYRVVITFELYDVNIPPYSHVTIIKSV